MERRHSDVLIAGLILVGATMWLGSIVAQLTDTGYLLRLALWLAAGVAAAQIARRLLVDLEVGETAIAAVVSMAIVIGELAYQRGQTMNVEWLLPIGTATAGAVIGALTSRRRRTEVGWMWRVLGGGFAGYGAAVFAVGIALIADGNVSVFGPAVLIGSIVGCIIVGLFTSVRGRHCALGLGLAFGGLLAISNPQGLGVWTGLIGLGLGAVLGAIGGAIGGRINAARKPKPTLPEAHVQ